MNIQWIVAPLVGCVIGYITNWVAIKMLFRPFKPHYIGKWRIPLTPGLIPKEKARLAASVGDVISNDLLNAETIQSSLLSGDMLQKIEGGADHLIEQHRQDERTLAQLVCAMTGEETYQSSTQAIQAGVVDLLARKLTEARLGDIAAQAIVEHVKKKSPSALSGLVSGLLDERVKQNIMGQLGDGVNNYVRDNAQELLTGVIDSESDKLMNTRLCDLIAQHEDKLPDLKSKLLKGYEALIRSGTQRVLSTVDISAIVRGRIESLDDRELEALILGVISRELNAIVLLGAGLGFIMGFINLLFA